MQTIVTASANINIGAANVYGIVNVAATSNYSAGSTVIKTVGAAPVSNTKVWLSQCDNVSTRPCGGTYTDNGGVFVCGDDLACSQQARGNLYEHQQQQLIAVSSVNNGDGTYDVTVSPKIYAPTWAYSHSPRMLWNDPSYNAVGVGLEDMTLIGAFVDFSQAYAGWIKGVRFIRSIASMRGGKNNLISNNYFFPIPQLDSTYDPAIETDTSADSLILNNVFNGSTTWEGNGGNAGNVFAYNYGRDTFTAYYENMPFDHAAWSELALFEGNQMGAMLDDNTWGAHSLNTFARNYLSCWDPAYETQHPKGLAIDGQQRFDNAIGNSIGTPSYCTTYQGTGDGSVFRIDTTDSLVASTLMRWGNCDTVTASCRFQSSEVPSSLASPNAAYSVSVPTTNTLPASFFMSTAAHPSGGTGLSWWKVCTAWTSFPTGCSSSGIKPFPAVGPDVSGGAYVNGHAHDIPAALAWLNLPIDTTYQNSYTVTSSSWAGGRETLTITGLPDGTHLMGPFQLSGSNAACATGATINASNEILMTSSNATTISYALASNPSLSCTGTFKFPDVRQFDQRVYQTDSGAGSKIHGKAVLKGVAIQ